MTDYSKPIGWWCPDCGAEFGTSWAEVNAGHKGQTTCNGVGREYHRVVATIPVYTVIPEGEREETNHPSRNTMCTKFSAPSPSTPFIVFQCRGRRHTMLDWMEVGEVVSDFLARLPE